MEFISKMNLVSKLRQKSTIIIIVVVIVLVIIWLSTRGGGSTQNGANVDTAANNVYSSTTAKVALDDVTTANAPASSVPLEIRKLAVQAFQNSYETMTSMNSSKIRSIMLARANTPAEKKMIDGLKDADLISLSSRLAVMMVKPPTNILIDPYAVWLQEGNKVSVVIAPTAGATTTLSATLIDGKWY